MGSWNQGMGTKCGIHGKCSCCTIQEGRYHHCSIGRYDTCAQPIRCKMYQVSIPSMLYMYDLPVFRTRWSKMINMVVWYAMWLCYGYCLQALCFSLFLKSFFYMATYAKCTNQDSNCVYAGTILWHKGWYDDTKHMIWYVCNGRYGSLMCISNIAGNTQMASLDRQVTQNGLRG